MGASVLDLPQVQDALRYVLAQLAAWQDVPARIARDQAALRLLAARAAGDPGTLTALTAYQQALQGVQQQFLESSGLTAGVFRTAQSVQAGGSVNAGQIADAGRLAGVIATGLGSLAQVEGQLRDAGADLTPGPGGGAGVPGWLKWSGIGLGLWWFYRHVLRRRAA